MEDNPDEVDGHIEVDCSRSSVEPLSREAVDAALLALRAMAMLSARRQADVEVALSRVMLNIPKAQYPALTERLMMVGAVKDVIALQDGGMLLTVIVR